ncbi:hypothetical protein BDZ89DRAFT_1043503 [Hymenopellis radicata]|nr:hypothetical protein BDZ89DRAFT_1043503 [Hymenopellis radicata]
MSSVAQHLGMSDAEVIQVITANLNQHIMEIFTYGLYTMVFVSTMHQIGARNGADKWPLQRIALTIIICVIWALATFSPMSPIDSHRTQTVLGYVMLDGDGNWSKNRLVLNAFAYTAVALNAILAELINVWRCWELYNRNYLIAGLPLLCVLCGLRFTGDPSRSSSLSAINWQIVYYSVTAFTNVLTTFLIIFRILSFGGLRIARTYRGLLEILIESAFLYSVTYILYLGLYLRDVYMPNWSFTNYYAQGVLNAVTALAPTMIMGRVMSGGARPNDSWTRSSLPSMGSTMRSLEESIRFGSVHPAQTPDTMSTLDTTGQAEDAIGSLAGEGNMGVSGDAVAGHAGESEVHGSHVGLEIQVEQWEGLEVLASPAGESEDSEIQVEKREGVEILAGHARESEIQIEKRDGAEAV